MKFPLSALLFIVLGLLMLGFNLNALKPLIAIGFIFLGITQMHEWYQKNRK